jgi:hypothetical protein
LTHICNTKRMAERRISTIFVCIFTNNGKGKKHLNCKNLGA